MRPLVKRQLARIPDRVGARGATLLVYHRVGGRSADELDVPVASFEEQLEMLAGHDVSSLDGALDRLDDGDDRPSVVLTFDDGFADLYRHAFPRLRERRLPFVVYLVAGLVGGAMRWEGGTAKDEGAALSWGQLVEMSDSGLCTVANHTWSHATPEALDEAELDRCSAEIERLLGEPPRHFAYPWGVEVPRMRPAMAARFRSAATGVLGRNPPGTDRLALRRVPVRGSDPAGFFRAKLRGHLRAERAYAAMVATAKRGGLRA